VAIGKWFSMLFLPLLLKGRQAVRRKVRRKLRRKVRRKVMTKPKIILIGAGVHFRSCMDVIEQEAKF